MRNINFSCKAINFQIRFMFSFFPRLPISFVRQISSPLLIWILWWIRGKVSFMLEDFIRFPFSWIFSFIHSENMEKKVFKFPPVFASSATFPFCSRKGIARSLPGNWILDVSYPLFQVPFLCTFTVLPIIKEEDISHCIYSLTWLPQFASHHLLVSVLVS